MLAIDTNVIVRYLTGDHPEQSPRARALLDSQEVFVGTTVLLEVEWDLRSAYGYPSPQVCEALRALAGLPGVMLEDSALAATALDWMAVGMDFADALHLAGAEGRAAFVSFDRRLAKAAKRLSRIEVHQPQVSAHIFARGAYAPSLRRAGSFSAELSTAEPSRSSQRTASGGRPPEPSFWEASEPVPLPARPRSPARPASPP